VPRRVTVTAPDGAYAARVLFYSPIGARGRFYADGIRFGETRDAAPAGDSLFVGPSATGTGGGEDARNLADYNAPAFWTRVLATLTSRPVTVTFASGAYEMRRRADAISLAGRTSHRLTLRGEDPAGSVIVHATTDADLGNDLNGATMLRLDRLEGGLTVADLTFSSSKRPSSAYANDGHRIGYALQVLRSSHVELRNVAMYDIHGIQYGGFGPHRGTTDVLVRDSNFARLGYDSHAHFSYCANDVTGLTFDGNQFEDVMGEYIRFRNNCDGVVVTRNRFQSTGTWYNERVNGASRGPEYKNPRFVSWAVFNDGAEPTTDPSDPARCPDVDTAGRAGALVEVDERTPLGDEWLGEMHAVIEDNSFHYLRPAATDLRRFPIAIVASGMNPSASYGAPRDFDYLGLMSLSSVNATDAERHLGVAPADWIAVHANEYTGTEPEVTELLVTTAHYDFLNRVTSRCDSTRNYHPTYRKSFSIDSLLLQ
jgi:hypothetical protein